MSGYREQSFDPSAGFPDRGPPMRPYNVVQWIGVGLILVGAGLDVAYVGGRLGWWPMLLTSPAPLAPLPLFGVVLISSRRQPAADPAPELAAARRKWMAIVVAICCLILGIATIFAMKGY